MIKKNNIRPIYIIDQKKFDTFKRMKTYIWYNIHTDKEINAYELINDEVQKHYVFIKKERRLLCNIVYDKDKEYKKWCDRLQLKLF